MGFYKKNIFPLKHLERGRTTPSPFTYEIKRDFDMIDEARTDLKLQQSVLTGVKRAYSFNRAEDKPLEQSKKPAPGSYDIREKVGQNKLKWSLFPKRKMFNE